MFDLGTHSFGDRIALTARPHGAFRIGSVIALRCFGDFCSHFLLLFALRSGLILSLATRLGFLFFLHALGLGSFLLFLHALGLCGLLLFLHALSLGGVLF
ncbi:MAG: hypothetical protein AAFP68_18540, partial [Pseudomonadota bacterium]